MKRLSLMLLVLFFAGNAVSQELPALKLFENTKESVINKKAENHFSKSNSLETKEPFQLKKRKTVNSYFGAGYAFIIFTDGKLSNIYPVLDTRSGAFLTNISVFFGFAVSGAVAIEFEPAILFASSSKSIETFPVVSHGGTPNDTISYSSNMGLFALPLAVNVKFFPMWKLKTFARLIFIGGGIGYQWIKEDYDNFYSRTRQPLGYYGGVSESTDQWSPIFRIAAGVTGTGGQFGFGGEVRYNFVSLKQETGSPFMTRVAKNFNSVDINLRFYFSL